MAVRANSISIEERLKTGGFLSFREFCEWVGFSHVTGYKEVNLGRLRITKVRRQTKVAARDALAYRDLLLTAVHGEAA